MMLLLLAAIGVLLLGGLGALLARHHRRWATLLGVGGAVAGCLIGLAPVLAVLRGHPAQRLRAAWDVPYGSFSVELDALSALFLLPILGLCALAAVYGAGYLRHHERETGVSWFFFDVLTASMAVVTVARNGVLFLVAWEVMALASFYLVTFEDDDRRVRDAGWTYLVASHLGTTFLLALFVLLGDAAGSLDFDRLSPGTRGGLAFVLALVGFGTKAGLMPFHVWLPEAHPAAPSHVSAVMSAVMIKMGVYGILRMVILLGPLPAWCGATLIALGLVSGVLGVFFALAQHDLKRLLAYSSVENAGVIALGLGLGMVGLATGSNEVAVLGFAGGLAHVLNHGVFKGLLFLAAGAVVHATRTRDLDGLGGLQKRMPWTGLTFLVGAAAISALPPLNGFASEFLIYLAALAGATSAATSTAVPGLAVVAGLGLIGGLVAALFTKAFGIVFLGSPRDPRAAGAHEPGRAMRMPLQVLALACVAIGVLSPLLVLGLSPLLSELTGLPGDVVRESLGRGVRGLTAVTACSLGLVVAAGLTAALRRWLLAGREVTTGVTWDCGYAAPSARMQYTGSSFSQPLTALVRTVLRPRGDVVRVSGFFPRAAAFHTETPDVLTDLVYGPTLRGIRRGLSSFRWLQHGRVQLYVLYIALTLLGLLVWKIGVQ
jgi:formate hydrogenlyase subunit 3/multisubunit Na+/H+ antiporter MnhD subunit